MKYLFPSFVSLCFASLVAAISPIAADDDAEYLILEDSEHGATTMSPGKTTGRMIMKPAFRQRIRMESGLSPFNPQEDLGGDVEVQTTFLVSTTNRHVDYLAPDENQNRHRSCVPCGDTVGFIPLNTNKDAHLDVEETCVPIVKDKLVLFKAQAPHHTVVNSGHVSLIGPFHIKSMNNVGVVPTSLPSPPVPLPTSLPSPPVPLPSSVPTPSSKKSKRGSKKGSSSKSSACAEVGEACEIGIDCCDFGGDTCSDTEGIIFCGSNTCTDFCRRRLEVGEIVEDNPSPRRSVEIIESMGADPKATFSFKHDLITKESCDALIQHLEASLASDVASGKELPRGPAAEMHGLHSSWTPFDGGIDNQYNMKLYADDLVKLIGRDQTYNILDFFYSSIGEDHNIDCMYLARHGNPPDDELYHVPWHMDDYSTMEITLNDNYEGGDVLHLTPGGAQRTESRPGTATAHGTDIVHGITPNTKAPKYMLILKHHYNRPEKEGVVRISYDIVEKLTTAGLRKA